MTGNWKWNTCWKMKEAEERRAMCNDSPVGRMEASCFSVICAIQVVVVVVRPGNVLVGVWEEWVIVWVRVHQAVGVC